MEDLSLQNKILEKIINKIENVESVILWNEYKKLKEENKELNKIIELENPKVINNLNKKSNKNESLVRRSIDDNQNNDVILFSYRQNKNSPNKFSNS